MSDSTPNKSPVPPTPPPTRGIKGFHIGDQAPPPPKPTPPPKKSK